MKFEQILPLLREGKKAKHLRMKDGEYWMCCNAYFMGSDQAWPILTKLFKNPFDKGDISDVDSYSWGIERWAIMADDWEIVE